MRADLVTIVGPPGTHVPDTDEITPPSISSRQANVFMHLLLSVLGPKPELDLSQLLSSEEQACSAGCCEVAMTAQVKCSD